MKTLATITLLVLAVQVRAYPKSPGVVEEQDFTVEESIVPETINRNEELKDLDPATRVSYAGSQLWRVVAENSDKKKIIGKLRDTRDISMWGGNVTAFDILVRGKSKEVVKRQLDKNNMLYEIVIEDVQNAIDTENPPVEDDEELAIRQARKVPFRFLTAWRGLTSLGNSLEIWPDANWGHRMTWQSYHRTDDINGYLDYLAQTYPQLCSVQTIGSSVQGRPIKILKISNGNQDNKAVWVDGGMHAREWISPATVTFIINQFVLNFDSEPKEIQGIDWYFLPVANPDGYEYSHTVDRLWRKNRARSGTCAGTDLNRNFGYKWGGKGSGRNPCQEIYGGSYAFSEPETAAISNFITSTPAKWRGSVSFHSYGQYILFPWGYDRVFASDHKDLLAVAQKAANAIRAIGGPSYTVGPAGNTLYPASGGSDDWAKGTVGMKYAYTIELRDSGRYGFVLPAYYIKPTATEGLAALRVIGTAAFNA